MKQCLHITVSGRVQGVYFRANAKKQAQKLNIYGYVRNLDNGDVEILALGVSSALEQFISWCHQGPIMAKVSVVKVREHTSNELHHEFLIL